MPEYYETDMLLERQATNFKTLCDDGIGLDHETTHHGGGLVSVLIIDIDGQDEIDVLRGYENFVKDK